VVYVYQFFAKDIKNAILVSMWLSTSSEKTHTSLHQSEQTTSQNEFLDAQKNEILNRELDAEKLKNEKVFKVEIQEEQTKVETKALQEEAKPSVSAEFLNQHNPKLLQDLEQKNISLKKLDTLWARFGEQMFAKSWLSPQVQARCNETLSLWFLSLLWEKNKNDDWLLSKVIWWLSSLDPQEWGMWTMVVSLLGQLHEFPEAKTYCDNIMLFGRKLEEQKEYLEQHKWWDDLTFFGSQEDIFTAIQDIKPDTDITKVITKKDLSDSTSRQNRLASTQLTWEQHWLLSRFEATGSKLLESSKNKQTQQDTLVWLYQTLNGYVQMFSWWFDDKPTSISEYLQESGLWWAVDVLLWFAWFGWGVVWIEALAQKAKKNDTPSETTQDWDTETSTQLWQEQSHEQSDASYDWISKLRPPAWRMNMEFKATRSDKFSNKTKYWTDFISEVVETSKRMKIYPEFLMRIFEHESWFDPHIQNSIGATWLIQFMPSTAEWLWTSTNALKRMNATQQLKYVEKFYENYNKPKGSLNDMWTLYMCTFLPLYRNEPDNFVLYSKSGKTDTKLKNITTWYSQNKWFDTQGGNNDGIITVWEVKNRIRSDFKVWKFLTPLATA